MVFAHAVNRITLSGTMFQGSEEWSTGFYFGEEGADATPFTPLGVKRIADQFAIFFQNSDHVISNKYTFTQAKAALIDTNGNTVLDQVHYASPTGTIVGGSTGAAFPPQCALVVSLLSDRPRGKASKGRMYLPGHCSGIQDTGKIATQWRDAVATGMKTFFDSLTNHIDIPNELILAAKGTGPAPALTAQNDYVETLRVGDVIDTQRRRRNGLTEMYTSRVLA